MRREDLNNEDTFHDDVTELVEKSIVEEANEKVWSTFDKALNQLDIDSKSLLSEYFNGASVMELSRNRGLSMRDVEEWLSRAKRILFQELRQECNIRQ